MEDITRKFESLQRDFNTTVEELVSLNGIPNPNLIYINQLLKVPTKVTGENNKENVRDITKQK